MAAASFDTNFKEDLRGHRSMWVARYRSILIILPCHRFKVLSEAERTAALYSLLQHSAQVQIHFFITILQQMARADPMTALMSPAVRVL